MSTVGMYNPRYSPYRRQLYNTARKYGPQVMRYAYDKWRNYKPTRNPSKSTETRYKAVYNRSKKFRPKTAAKSYQGKQLPPGQKSIRSKSRKAISKKVAGKPLNLQQLTDIICPLVKMESETPHNEITWDSNQQGYGMFNYLDYAELQVMWAKMNSADVINHPASILGIGSTSVASSIMQYTAGYIEYTVINSCNHTVEVLFNTFKPKGRHSLSLYECWDKDLSNDDTILNVTPPINVERDKQDYGTPIIQPANPNSYVQFRYKLLQAKRVVLAVGETFVYKVKHSAFSYDTSKETMAIYGTTAALYGPQMCSTSIVARAQLVTDSTGSKVAHGSGKLGVSEKIVSFSRSGLQQKRYQTINHGGLDVIADADQYHYNVDTETETQFTFS